MPTNNSWNSQSPAQVTLGGTGQTTYTDGQLLIGNSTGNTLTKATLASADGSVTITNGSGSIDLKASSAFPWTEVTGTSQLAAVNNGYITNNAARVGVTLPSTVALGSVVKVAGKGAGGWSLAPNAGQTLYDAGTSVVYPGLLKSSSAHDCVDVVTITANTEYDVLCKNGTLSSVILDYSIGNISSYYLKNDGSCWGCGLNASGELGNNTNTSYSSPIAMVGAHSFIAVCSENQSTMALKADGSVWTCGLNSAGGLGDLSITSRSSPVLVVGSHSFIQITNGDSFKFGLKANGSAWGFGANSAGQLGQQNTTNYSSPVSVVGAHSFIQITAGSGFFCGLKADGSAWTCGNNFYGTLGNGSRTNSSSPVAVIGAHSFIQVCGGSNDPNSCYGLKSDGSIWAWGANPSGELGQQNTTSYSSPVQVVGSHSFVELNAGKSFVLAKKNDGSVWSWGLNSSGELGDNTRTNHSSPVLVVGNTFYALANNRRKSSPYFSAFSGALKIDGTFWLWGDNSFGQLAQQNRTSYSSPVVAVGLP